MAWVDIFFLKGGGEEGILSQNSTWNLRMMGFFQKEFPCSILFQGLLFRFQLLNFFGGVSISGHWTFPVFYFNLLYVSSWTFRQEEHEFLRNSMQMRR